MPEHPKQKSGIQVTPGVAHAPSLNPNLHVPPPREKLSTEQLLNGLRTGSRVQLARAITLVESTRAADQIQANTLIERCLPWTGNALRLGITGVPGVGKSAFIEALGTYLVERGKRLAVLAIDPSSERTKGSILGDKTRMKALANHPSAFIRPSPSAGSLGGVARKTREVMYLCEAAGYDVIVVETVGVGQSETAVAAMVDFFLLLALAGAGDELQGIKRGIMELADAIAITKADGANEAAAKLARGHYRNALHLFPPRPDEWRPPVHTCSAFTGAGIDAIWASIESYKSTSEENGAFLQRRQEQAIYWMKEAIQDQLVDLFFAHPGVKALQADVVAAVRAGTMTSHAAARLLINTYKPSKADSPT